MSFLRNDPDFYLDFLASLCGVDDGEQLWVVYHLYSIPYGYSLVLKVALARDNPVVDSISDIYAAANWHERETYDLFGITFANHPDLRRILLPEDWAGHPMRKDYQEADSYHDIDVAY
ncbi:MAG: NADH-quinone oxidoreductase subunit C [Bacteroidetes bacterium]|nr:NADH-quinone oxidoreductase subunit C [Bacteroidota bacterium]